LAAGVPWVQRACWPAAGVVVDTVWMVESAARVTLYGDQEPATLTTLLGGYGSLRELGHVLVSFTGSIIDAVRLEEAWPDVRFWEGRHFVDERFRLPLVERSTSVCHTSAWSDGPYWARPTWHCHRGSSVSGVHESILDGTYTVAKNSLPRRPIFRKLGRVLVAGSSGGAAGHEWGGQWQTTVTVSRHAGEPHANLSWSQEWVVGFHRANQPSTMLSFLGLQLETASSLAAPSGSCSTLQRVDWAGDMSEAHNLHLGARGHAVVSHSLVAGSTGNIFSHEPGQANVWRAAASWLRVYARAYGAQNRVREPQTRTRPSTGGGGTESDTIFGQGRRAQNIQSAASFTGGARILSGAEASAGHSQPSYSPAATRRRPDGGCGSPVYGTVALLGAAPRARPGLRVGARPKFGGNTGSGGTREPVGNQRGFRAVSALHGLVVAHARAAGVWPGDGKAPSIRGSNIVPCPPIQIHAVHGGLVLGARSWRQDPHL
jgi:hypothetical protein